MLKDAGGERTFDIDNGCCGVLSLIRVSGVTISCACRLCHECHLVIRRSRTERQRRCTRAPPDAARQVVVASGGGRHGGLETCAGCSRSPHGSRAA
jgi:hypothetical protein